MTNISWLANKHINYMISKEFKTYALKSSQPLSKSFTSLGINNFNEAITYIHKLPYGRNSQRDNYDLVLKENRGTCSTKHAILKSLADEQNIDLTLALGIYLMTKSNTPAICETLEKYEIDAIPEAHCYLRSGHYAFDITFHERMTDPDTLGILTEKSISPNQIGGYKICFHRTFIKNWIISEKLSINFDEIWGCREECIKKLSEK